MFSCKARKKPNREAYNGNTLSGAVCSATKQMSVFQQPHYRKLSAEYPRLLQKITRRQREGDEGKYIEICFI
jgi:hypothetical protein